MRNKHIAALAIAGLLGMGATTLAATSAYAAEQPGDKVCTAPETHTEITYALQRSDWVGATEGSPAEYGAVGDYSDTRATGHYEATADGLHIWTEGSTSTDKVAGYLGVDVPLAGADASFVDYTATAGINPGAQLVISDGESSGILVGEAVYGGGWWLSNSASQAFKDAAPHVGGGYGSEWYGTLTEWGAALPDVSIVAVGFSLGSGVLGDGVVHGITLNGVTYSFIEQTAPAVDPVPEHYTDWYEVSTGQGLALPDGHADGEEFQTDGLYRYVVTGEVEVTEQVEVECPATEEPESSEEPAPTEGPEPTTAPTPSETPAPVATSSSSDPQELAETGVDQSLWIAGGVGLVLMAGGVLTLVLYRTGRKANHRA